MSRGRGRANARRHPTLLDAAGNLAGGLFAAVLAVLTIAGRPLGEAGVVSLLALGLLVVLAVALLGFGASRVVKALTFRREQAVHRARRAALAGELASSVELEETP